MFLKTQKKPGILLIACLLIFGTTPLAFGSEIGDIVEGLKDLSNLPDEKWMDTALTDSDVVNKDIINLNTASDNYDYESLSMYADNLAADSQAALDNSNSYTLSGDVTKIMKGEYDLAMEQAGQAAIYIKNLVEENKKGNKEGVKSNEEKATEYLNSYIQHMNFVYKSIHDLNCARTYSLCINGNGYKCREKFNKCMGQIV
jgi:hypothetical protein